MSRVDGPCFHGRKHLWSLADVIGKYGLAWMASYKAFAVYDEFCRHMRSIVPPELRSKRFPAPASGQSEGEAEAFRRLDEVLADPEGGRGSYAMTLAQFKRLADLYKRGFSVNELEACLKELKNRFEDEQARIQFYRLEEAYARYYGDRALFGEEVAARFPAAGDDVEDAGNCLALGQGTAAVYHLMRVMEHGLRAVSNMLGIPYAPSWESHLKQIEANIKADHKGKAPEWKRDEAFFKELLGDLAAIRIAWRNPTMHIGRRYSQEEAEQVYHAVRLFMRRVAAKLAGAPTEPEEPA